MGWWRINPETGEPLQGASSSLSRPPEFVLLNAVPGVDGSEGACYLGDGPSDMVSTLPAEFAAIVGPQASWSAAQIRALLLYGRVRRSVGARAKAQLKKAVEVFWADIDDCYDFDWERPAFPAEKRWICEEAVERLTQRST
jgi:hypothetical protein